MDGYINEHVKLNGKTENGFFDAGDIDLIKMES